MNFQVSFIAKLTENACGSTITGKFDAPKIYYLICIWGYLLLSALFLIGTVIKNGFMPNLVLQVFILGITWFAGIVIGIMISKAVFRRENRTVLSFLEAIASDYPL